MQNVCLIKAHFGYYHLFPGLAKHHLRSSSCQSTCFCMEQRIVLWFEIVGVRAGERIRIFCDPWKLCKIQVPEITFYLNTVIIIVSVLFLVVLTWRQMWVVLTEIRPAKPKILLPGSLQKKFADPWSMLTFSYMWRLWDREIKDVLIYLLIYPELRVLLLVSGQHSQFFNFLKNFEIWVSIEKRG